MIADAIRALIQAQDAAAAAAEPPPPPVDLPTEQDYINQELALASLTETLEDDKAARRRELALREREFAEAQASNDPRRIAEAANALKQSQDAMEALTGALEQNTNALAEEIKGLREEIRRQTDFATNVVATENFQLVKGLADILSGHIAGYGVAGRALTAGAGGMAVRY